MKKIMFNDRFRLTQAVLEGRKTMTRRVCKGEIPLGNWEETEKHATYHVGEVVAIAQNYNDVLEEWKKGYGQGIFLSPKDEAGMTNKMFVRADDMPHHIKITNIRVEHLQDISDEDCLREGIYMDYDAHGGLPFYDYHNNQHNGFDTPLEAFAALIDKVSGKGTWESNPMVWVYEFELVD